MSWSICCASPAFHFFLFVLFFTIFVFLQEKNLHGLSMPYHITKYYSPDYLIFWSATAKWAKQVSLEQVKPSAKKHNQNTDTTGLAWWCSGSEVRIRVPLCFHSTEKKFITFLFLSHQSHGCKRYRIFRDYFLLLRFPVIS